MLVPGWGSLDVPKKVRPKSLRVHGLDPLFLTVNDVHMLPSVCDTTGSAQKWRDIIGHFENSSSPVAVVSLYLGPNKVDSVPTIRNK